MNADLAFQIALRARLTGTAAVTALVPAAAVLDRRQRPVPMPSIVLGETQLVDEGTSLKRGHLRLYHTLHLWVREPSLEGVKGISAAVRAAVHGARLDLGEGLHCADQRVSSIRHLRDPDGETSHGVVTVEALIVETA